MIQLIGIGLAIVGLIVGLTGWFGFENIPATIFGGALVIIGVIPLIKG